MDFFIFPPKGIHMCYINRYTSPCHRFLKLVLTSLLYDNDTYFFKKAIPVGL